MGQYNYYYHLTAAELRAGDLEAGNGSEDSGSERVEIDDCAICMCGLNITVDDNAEATEDCNNTLYMRTPCGHKFHKPCLKNWMEYKLECPSCRAQIPMDDDSDEE